MKVVSRKTVLRDATFVVQDFGAKRSIFTAFIPTLRDADGKWSRKTALRDGDGQWSRKTALRDASLCRAKLFCATSAHLHRSK
ncbi:hypothetical protein ACFXTH_008444 [Malus domestica]